MVKPHKKKRRADRSPASPTPSRALSQPTEPLPVKAKGKIRLAGTRLFNSALDYALQHVWDVVKITVGGAMLTTIGALILYVRTGQASWLVQWLKYGAVFIGGIFSLALVIVILALFKKRSERLKLRGIEDAKNLQFVTDELGFIDFFANKERAEAELAKVLVPIVKEIDGLGATARKHVGRIKPNTPFIKRQEISTQTASILNEHTGRLEQYLRTFKEIDDVLAESNVGCVNWLKPEEHQGILFAMRRSANALLNGIHSALPSMQFLLNATVGMRGTSQNLNTASSRLTHTLNGLIAALSKSEARWSSLIALIDNKTQ